MQFALWRKLTDNLQLLWKLARTTTSSLGLLSPVCRPGRAQEAAGVTIWSPSFVDAAPTMCDLPVKKFQLSLSESIPLHSLGEVKRGQKRSMEFSNYSPSLAKPEESSERLVSQAPRKEEVVVGRLLSFALVHGIPDNAMVSLFSQLHNSGVPVGHKFHSRDGIRRFAALTCARQNLKEQFLLSSASDSFLIL